MSGYRSINDPDPTAKSPPLGLNHYSLIMNFYSFFIHVIYFFMSVWIIYHVFHDNSVFSCVYMCLMKVVRTVINLFRPIVVSDMRGDALLTIFSSGVDVLTFTVNDCRIRQTCQFKAVCFCSNKIGQYSRI